MEKNDRFAVIFINQFSLSIFPINFLLVTSFSVFFYFYFIPTQKWQEAYELYRRKLFQFQIVQVLILPEDQANSN